jgi:hypothetical protein
MAPFAGVAEAALRPDNPAAAPINSANVIFRIVFLQSYAAGGQRPGAKKVAMMELHGRGESPRLHVKNGNHSAACWLRPNLRSM